MKILSKTLLLVSVLTAQMAVSQTHTLTQSAPILNEQARGDEVALNLGAATAKEKIQGGWGEQVSVWRLEFEILVRVNGAPQISLFNLNGVYGPQRIEAKVEEISPGRYRITADVRYIEKYEIQVMIPEGYNQTPHIGNSNLGFYGPVYGVTQIAL